MEQEKKWQDLWLDNYKGEGDCAELESFLKTLDYGSRKGVTYLPWAVVDRIFKMQGGKTETINYPRYETYVDNLEEKKILVSNTIVEVDTVHIRDEVDSHGVVTPKYMNSYFVNIRAEWHGQVHIERYPLLNSTGQALSFWTQIDLNKAVQRGKVKAIAIVSGIGYKLFEDGDLQFEDEGGKPDETKKKADDLKNDASKKPKSEPKAEKGTKPEPTPEPKPEKETKKIKEEPKPSVLDDLETEVEEEATEEQQPKKVAGAISIPEKREDIENEIKRLFLTGGAEKSTTIRTFLKDHGTKVITSLVEEDLKELYVLIK